MAEDKLDVSAFMKTLLGLADEALLGSIERAELAYHQQATQLHGFVALSRAFKSFVLGTVNLSSTWQSSHSLSQTHAWLLPRMAGSFHTICGAEQGALIGYPGPAFALLRNVFDTALVSAAVGQGFNTWREAEGLVEGEPFDPQKIHRRRKQCEFAVNARMVGVDSGLSDAVRRELGQLNKLYDFETHGQRMTATTTMAWMKGEGPLYFLPHYGPLNYALFVNRFSEVAWMVHRLVPLMWPPDVPAEKNWCERWTTLDQCFRQTSESMTTDLKKAVGQAVVEFVENKLPFNARSRLAV